jgi:peptidyl-tRNA hydrolase
MANLRQTIIVREDLNLPRGLLTAQIAHIHMEFMRQKTLTNEPLTEDEKEWLEAPYVFVHGVPNIEFFNFYKKLAKDYGVPLNVWKDTIYLSIEDKEVVPFSDIEVGMSLGPCDSDRIKSVVGNLPLLR